MQGGDWTVRVSAKRVSAGSSGANNLSLVLFAGTEENELATQVLYLSPLFGCVECVCDCILCLLCICFFVKSDDVLLSLFGVGMYLGRILPWAVIRLCSPRQVRVFCL